MLNTVRGVRTYRDVISTEEFDIVLDDISHYPYYPAHFMSPEGTANAVFMHTAFFGAAREYVGPVKGTVIDLIDRTLPLLNRPEIICAGESTEQRIHTKLDYWQTHVLHPTVRADSFTYNFAPDSDIVLYLGRLDVRKNVACLVRAWSQVERESNRDLTLVVAGTGPHESMLKALVDELELESVQFRGYVSEEEKRRLFAEALVYVLPSKMEGYVTTGLEAMAAGTPVIGSDTYGINDYVTHDETGYLFPVDDHPRLAEQLLELTSSPELMRSVAERGREVAAEHSFDAFTQYANEVFSAVAGNEK
jgi:glycosyltransferase involved in cell wall biosynthesis